MREIPSSPTEEERTARQIAEKREAADRNAQLAKRRKRVTLESFDAAVAEGKMDTLNLIIKGDVSGAVEALEESLMKIDVGGDEVQLRVIHRGVGAITQNDVNLATVDNAVIIGFNVRPAERVSELADREGVEMKFYSVIYARLRKLSRLSRACSNPNTKRLNSARRRSVKCSVPPSGVTSQVRWSRTALSSVIPRHAWYVTVLWCQKTSPSSRCVVSRTMLRST